MSRTRKEEQHHAIREEIKAAARELMAQEGSSGLSIRAIGRMMEMTAPALYHYYPSREALITDLILDAFNSLGEQVEGTRDLHADEPAPSQLLAVCLAYRQWALDHPTDFALIYGTPIPGYVAPGQKTVPAASRSYLTFVSILARALESGEIQPPDWLRDPPAEQQAAMRRLAEPYQQMGLDFPLNAHYMTAVGWTRMHGVIMLELFNHLQPVVGDVDAFYRLQLEEMFRAFGLKRQAAPGP
ncbi:MAG TPA: TetR/AcrR family transcriptional regulator [Anaerolineaceae bacterium]|nr:TetR/AcrR family transcriptional regulator [Anaerolineaceae bacterium]